MFISAFLVFQVQLVTGRYLLPWFGGTPAVFATCMLFFQVVLVAGYAYSYLLSKWLTVKQSAVVHGCLLVAAVALLSFRGFSWSSPIFPGNTWKPVTWDQPIPLILLMLGFGVGLPFFVISTTAPLLQQWLSSTGKQGSPYRLYAVSNVGSVLALVTYPIVVEPILSLRAQARLWTWFFFLFAAICAYVTLEAGRTGSENVSASVSPADGNSRFVRWDPALWLLLAACGSALLIATTNQICQNVASVPLLWVLPLTIYLLSFVLCFSERGYWREFWIIALALATVLVCFAFYNGQLGVFSRLGMYLFALFSCCMVCHGEAVRIKPAPRYLTTFYLMISLGGAAGSALTVLLAPYIFRNFFWELHVAIWLCWVLLVLLLMRDKHWWVFGKKPWLLGVACVMICAGPLLGKERGPGAVLSAVAAMAALGFAFHNRAIEPPTSKRTVAAKAAIALALMAGFLPVMAYTNPVASSRNFYGILTILLQNPSDRAAQAYVLKHGRTLHGLQFLDASRRALPTAYFGPQSGIGLTLLNHPRRAAGSFRIGVVGLGAGTLAAYGRSADYFRFYEINPAVIRMAYSGTPPYFTYLKDSAATIDVIPGDARISMERELLAKAPQNLDVLAIDAFNGDTIPVHLLTEEAFGTYLRHLKRAQGIIAIHISNDALDLRPVVAGLAAHFHLSAVLVEDPGKSPGCQLSSWALLTRDEDFLRLPAIQTASTPLLSAGMTPRLWTDDFSNIFQLLRR